MATLPDLLKLTVEKHASDLHIATDTPPQVRVHGELERLEMPALTPAETKQLVYSVLTDMQKKRFEESNELDFSFGLKGLARFRCNVFMQRGAVGAVYRLNLAALVVPTTSGRTARLVSAHRPDVPVLAVSPRIETVRRLGLLFGVTAVLHEQATEVRALLQDCAELAARHGIAASGELIAITAGLPEQELGTNLFEVHRVP